MPEVTDQPPPVPNDRPAIGDMVITDLIERMEIGTKRYGTPLQAFNGRDPLVDGYQEALDLTLYLRQEIEERAYEMTVNRLEAAIKLVALQLGWDWSLITVTPNELASMVLGHLRDPNLVPS